MLVDLKLAERLAAHDVFHHPEDEGIRTASEVGHGQYVQLPVGCGDGRSMGLLSNLGMNISGTEITKEICEAVTLRMAKFGIKADIRVGRNNLLPFEDHFFDYVVASASAYYVDTGTTFEDNMLEILRVLKPGGHIVFSLVHPDSYILNGADELLDSHFRINNDPLGLRNGYFFKVAEDC